MAATEALVVHSLAFKYDQVVEAARQQVYLPISSNGQKGVSVEILLILLTTT